MRHRRSSLVTRAFDNKLAPARLKTFEYMNFAAMHPASRPCGADEPSPNREMHAVETCPDERLSLNEIEEKFAHRRGERSVDKLLRSVGLLRRYQQEALETRPSNAARDQMTKLGPEWYVRQKKQGTKRPPREIAREIEENIRDYAGRLLTNATPFTLCTPKKIKFGDPQKNSEEKEH